MVRLWWSRLPALSLVDLRERRGANQVQEYLIFGWLWFLKTRSLLLSAQLRRLTELPGVMC